MLKNFTHPFLTGLVCLYATIFACLPVLVTPAQAERLPPPLPYTPKPRLIVVTENFPPFQFERDGLIVGPMYDYVRKACDYAALECIISMLPWREALAQAESGRADVIFSILLGVREREDMFFTSPPVVHTTYSFFVASDSLWKWEGNTGQLEGMTIGTYGPSGTSLMARELLEQSDSARLVIERTNLTVFNNLIAGTYGPKAAVVVNKDVGLYLLAANNMVGPKLAGDLRSASFGVGYSRRSSKPELRTRFMSALPRYLVDVRVNPNLIGQ